MANKLITLNVENANSIVLKDLGLVDLGNDNFLDFNGAYNYVGEGEGVFIKEFSDGSEAAIVFSPSDNAWVMGFSSLGMTHMCFNGDINNLPLTGWFVNTELDPEMQTLASAVLINGSEIHADVVEYSFPNMDLKIFKVISTLPTQLEPNTLYLVRVGDGFDFYVTTNTEPTIARKLNVGDDALNSAFNTHNTDNVRHITGVERTKWDGVVTDFGNLEIGGRNLLPLDSWESGNILGESGEEDSTLNRTRTKGFIEVESLTEYTFSKGTDLFNSYRIFEYDESENFIVLNDGKGSWMPTPKFTFKTKTNTKYVRFVLVVSFSPENINSYQVQFEKGNKATDWSPAPEDQVSDWNTTDVNSFSYIKNKPTSLNQFTDNIGVATHIANKSNPHSVTKAQVKLGNVDNTSDLDKPISTAQQTALNNKVDKIVGKGLSTEDYTTAEKTKLLNIEDGAEKNKVNSVNSKTGDVVIDKTDIGLSNVENKSSAVIRNEITKTNVTNALGYTPENSSNKGVANGYAPLDNNIKIPLSMLPDIAKQQTYVVGTIADRDNLTGLIMGEKCYITTLGNSYIWNSTKWVTLAKADWENVNLQWTNIVGKPQSNVTDIDDATSKRHIHNNKGIIDTITQTLIDRWNSAWNHISDVIRHITSGERAKWNTVDNKADTTYVDTELNKKVDKVTGKGLSTEDYTTNEKNKLAGIASGAEVNVQSDWNATSGDAFIKNKPTTFTPSSHTHTKAQITDFAHNHDDRYYTESETDTMLGNKVTKNSSITANTKPKVSYDSKGLVTGGADLVATDIPNLPTSKITSGVFSADRIPKVISWSTTPSNNNIPSEKLVKDSLDSKSYTGHTHPISDITNLQTTLNNKLETSIFNTHNNDNIRHITGAERTKWNGVVTDFGNLEIGGRNLILQSQARVEKTNSPTQNWISPAYYLSEPLKIGQKYTFYCEGIEGTSINRLHFRDPRSDFHNVTGNKHTFTATAESTSLFLYLTDFSATYKIGGIKLVKGDKCDDWTPAPEDQVSDWNTTDVNSFSFIKNKPTTLADFTDNIDIGAHIANKSNPHSVTKAQVKLGNVENKSSATIRGEITKGNIESKLTGDITSHTHDSRYVIKNNPITAGTKPKVSYDSKGLVTSGADLAVADIPTLPQSKITNLATDLGNKVTKNSSITAGTKTKITYDAKGLVTGGADLVATDIPNLAASKITQDANNRFVTDTEKATWNAKLTTNAAITAGTKTKITYDSKGLVTGGADLAVTDIPTLPQSKITNLATDLGNKVTKNSSITAGTKPKITYDAKGLVTGGANLVATDIPTLPQSKVTNLVTDLGNKVTKNADIAKGTNTKITYDSKGLVISGANATTADITEGTRLYYTDSRARKAISLTTTGTSGAATYSTTTGVLNIPQYQAVLTNPITGTGTVNQIAYFKGTTRSLGSLSTATYPSLTELRYVKGVTSALQTQLNGKQATLVSRTNIKTIADNSILGSGNLINIISSITEPSPTSIVGGLNNGDIWVES